MGCNGRSCVSSGVFTFWVKWSFHFLFAQIPIPLIFLISGLPEFSFILRSIGTAPVQGEREINALLRSDGPRRSPSAVVVLDVLQESKNSRKIFSVQGEIPNTGGAGKYWF